MAAAAPADDEVREGPGSLDGAESMVEDQLD